VTEVIRAVILDFDGVLVESNEVKDAAFEEFFAFYPECEDEMLAYHRANISLPRKVKFERAAELMGRSSECGLIEEMGTRFSELVCSRVIACDAVLGSLEFLREFSGRIPLYISSVTPQEELRQILKRRNIDQYIVEAFGNPPMPKEAAIAQVLEREQLRPKQVVFIGDSLSDYLVSASMDLVFIGRDSGRSFAEAADVQLFPDLREIANLLSRRI
jgi:phosphoglycolate phosphatase-like HAD superfamily hydrolase